MILLALGSNQGDRAEFLRRARGALAENGIAIIHESGIVETPALLRPESPVDWNIPFLNQVLVVATAHTPHALLAFAKRIEQQLGRMDRGRWAPREIDIDMLAYDDVVLDDAVLTLPHPGIATRDFVLRPLTEIAPHWQHPLTGKTADEMLA